MAGTKRDRAGLLAIDTGTYIPDNTAGLVDPLNHRTSNEDINTSTTNFLDDNFEINVDGSHEYTLDPTGGWNGDAEHDLKFIPKKWLDDAISGFLVNDAIGANAIAIGGASSNSAGGVAIGNVADGGSGLTTIAIGDNSTVTGNRGISIGNFTDSVDGVAIGIGAQSTSTGVSLGQDASASNAGGIAIGLNSSSTGGTAIGNTASVLTTGVSISATVTGTRGIGIGAGSANVSTTDSIGIGSFITTLGNNAYAIGRGVKAGTNGVSVGFGAGSTSGTFGSDAIIIGTEAGGNNENIGSSSISIGKNTVSTATGATVFGYGSSAVTPLVNVVTDSFGFGFGELTPSFLYSKLGKWLVKTLPTFADDALAGVGGVATDEIYKTATGELRIKV